MTLTRDPEAQRRLDDDPLMVHGAISWATASSGTRTSVGIRTRYPELHIPVLVVHGSADRTPPASASRTFIGLVSSRDRQLHVVPDGLLGVLDDTSGPEVVRLLLDWLEERLPGAAGARQRT